MKTPRRKKHSIRRLVLALVALAILAFALPRNWTSWLLQLGQVFVPVHDAAHMASSALDGLGSPSSTNSAIDVSAANHRELAMQLRISDLEQKVAELTKTRFWNELGPSLGQQGRLIPARVLAPDIASWRDSRLVGAGSVHGVRADAAVTSAYFGISRGEDAAIRSGLAVVQSEVLLGVVDQVATHVSRVRLLTDPGLETTVRLVHQTEVQPAAVDGTFWLVGRGQGRMQVRDVNRRDVEAGLLAKGDWVLTAQAGTGLPTALVVGTIQEFTPDAKNPLLCAATVQAVMDVHTIDRVYVYDPGGDPP